jgi:hypothetical protein
MQEAPPGLGDPGRQLWLDMHAAVPESKQFDERDLAVLELACRQQDDIVLLQAALKADGVIVTGSQGQPVLSRTVTELRGARLALARLLKQLDLAEEKLTPQQAARKAARARWGGRPAPNNPINHNRVLPEAK